jgi:5-(carboxyamino)imidazole ribonucleotide mutase
MNVFVVYGSKSDTESYLPLVEGLKKDHQATFEPISAHRNLPELIERLDRNDYDVVVAGAGLAAALPGVCAAKTKKIVFGVPVSANFGGIDSLASIMQMPFGVPVITCGPNREDAIVDFLKSPEYGKNHKGINLVVRKTLMDFEFTNKEINRSMEYAKTLHIPAKVSSEFDGEFFNIVLVNEESDILKDQFCLHVPLLSDQDKQDYTKILELYSWTKTGGLWLGTNNTKNAILSFSKICKER